MLNKKLLVLTTLLLVVGILISACQPETIVETVVVTQEGETVVVTATPDPDAEEGEGEEGEEPMEGPVVGGSGDVYRIAALSDMTTTNIWKAYDPDASIWNYAVYISKYPSAYGLTTHRWQFVPALAADLPTDLEEEGDFWVSTVPLKQGAMWSDGAEITAEDWAWTANVALTLGLSGNWQSYDGAYLDRIEAVDPYTAKLYYHTKPGLARHEYGVLQSPILSKAFWEGMVTPLLDQYAEIADMDPESEEFLAQREEIIQALYQLDAAGEPSGGAWILDQWEPGAFSEVVKNDNYFDEGATYTEYENGALKITSADGEEWVAYGEADGEVAYEYVEGPWFDSTLFSIYNADAALLALEAGEVDFILNPNGLSRGQVDQVAGAENIDFTSNPANGFRYLGFNFDVPLMADIAVRQAIACQIDKEFLTQNLMQGAALPVNTIVPESNAYWYNADVPLFCDGMNSQERLEEAVRLLSEAGYTWDVEPTWIEDRGGSAEWGEGMRMPDGTPVAAVELLAPSAGYDPLRATAGVYIEQWINQLGIPTEANLTNFNNILDIVFGGGEWDMYILGWGVTAYPDYACDFFYSGAGFNTGKFNNPDFDAMCDEFYAETDLDTAQEQSYAIQEVLATELPYIYLFTTPIYDAWRSDNVLYPFLDVPDGIGAGAYGLKSFVQAVQ